MNIFNTDADLLHKEVLVSTDINTQLWNICVWDYLSGSQLLSYNNCSVQKKGLAFIKNDYMLCASSSKPFIYYWNLKSRNQQQLKISLSGCVSALDVSKCGNFIACAIDDKTYILHTYSGILVNCLGGHYQRVNDVKFNYNDKYLITSSLDSLILVWNFKDVCSCKGDELLEPTFTLDTHTLGINSIYQSRIMNKLVSVASDQTCKLWSYDCPNSKLQCSLSFSNNPTCVCMDSLESNVFIGFSNGSLISIPLKSIIHESNKIVNEQDLATQSFIGHKQQINCLSVSLDDCKLASGSDDLCIRVWDTLTRQCIKVLTHNGKITNLQFKSGSHFFSDDNQTTVVPLSARYSTGDDICISKILKKLSSDEDEQLTMKYFIDTSDLNEDCDEYFELKNKFECVKKANENIYEYALNQILK